MFKYLPIISFHLISIHYKTLKDTMTRQTLKALIFNYSLSGIFDIRATEGMQLVSVEAVVINMNRNGVSDRLPQCSSCPGR